MKKVLSSVLICCMLLFTAASLTACEEKIDYVGEISFYNWGEYIANGENGSRNLIKEFEKKTKIKVIENNFASNEEMYSKIKSGTAKYDLIIPSDYMIKKMIEEDMLAKINFDNIPNYKYIMDEYKGSSWGYDPADEYSVPYTWGTVGYVYNKTMVEGTPDGWDIFFNETYKGNILMFINPRDSFAIAQRYLGYSTNSEDKGEIQEAYELLKQQQPLVQAYVQDEMLDKMPNGEAAVSACYAGDAITMIEENPDLEFVFPKEGTNIFVDAMVIPKDCKNKEGAEAFINFLCETSVAKANIEYICYSTPHSEALKQLDANLRNNKIAYPDPDLLSEKCEAFFMLSPEITDYMNDLWVAVRQE